MIWKLLELSDPKVTRTLLFLLLLSNPNKANLFSVYRRSRKIIFHVKGSLAARYWLLSSVQVPFVLGVPPSVPTSAHSGTNNIKRCRKSRHLPARIFGVGWQFIFFNMMIQLKEDSYNSYLTGLGGNATTVNAMFILNIDRFKLIIFHIFNIFFYF